MLQHWWADLAINARVFNWDESLWTTCNWAQLPWDTSRVSTVCSLDVTTKGQRPVVEAGWMDLTWSTSHIYQCKQLHALAFHLDLWLQHVVICNRHDMHVQVNHTYIHRRFAFKEKNQYWYPYIVPFHATLCYSTVYSFFVLVRFSLPSSTWGWIDSISSYLGVFRRNFFDTETG